MSTKLLGNEFRRLHLLFTNFIFSVKHLISSKVFEKFMVSSFSFFFFSFSFPFSLHSWPISSNHGLEPGPRGQEPGQKAMAKRLETLEIRHIFHVLTCKAKNFRDIRDVFWRFVKDCNRNPISLNLNKFTSQNWKFSKLRGKLNLILKKISKVD